MKNISNPIQSSSKSSFFSTKIIALFRVLHLFFVVKISLETFLKKRRRRREEEDKKKSLQKKTKKKKTKKKTFLLREEERL